MVETAAQLATHERPPAPVVIEPSRRQRPDIVGPDSPQSPFPIHLSGAVQTGFGRGGKQLGCPTGETSKITLTIVFLQRFCPLRSEPPR